MRMNTDQTYKSSVFSGIAKLFLASFFSLTLLQGAATGAPDDGSTLPFPPTPSASIAKPRLQDSTHHRGVEKSHLPKDAPNILIVLLDDVGFGLPDRRPFAFNGKINSVTVDLK
jgi:arylsulfatase